MDRERSATLLVLANPDDEAARALVDRWSIHGAALLTPDDLSMQGWRHDTSTREDTLVVNGMPQRAGHLRGVLVRLPGVPEQELVRIHPGERAYVAAEMTAFLLAWLSLLPCPVLNRPTPACLTGPGWRSEQWLHTAAQVDIPIVPMRRSTRQPGSYVPPPDGLLPHTRVSVVGEQCLGPATPLMARYARRLSRAAGVELLDVHFAGPPEAPILAGASLWPRINEPLLADAMLAWFQQAGTRKEVRS
ncbi:hypothetical protein KYC5002_26590 [Archangium violaceum]|uniref:hypothetical protein n=1 Tax=Archangium violaceum TaxID=83451 RepID=UPI002B2D7430|nr:hypothetical protein KYC5002_26590 [Archangium gephyra]